MAEIRAARSGDIFRISEIHVRAWQAAYRGIMPDAYLDALQIRDRENFWRAFRDRVERSSVQVAECEEEVIGFIATGASDEDPRVGEVHVLNLDPVHRRRGVGSQLLASGTAELKALGFTEAVLWVVEQNQPARRFYEKHGWTAEDAIREYVFSGREVLDIRYRRPLL